VPRRLRPAALLAAAAVVALALWASADRAPRMPGDADHRPETAEARCLECHGRPARHPRPPDHPLRDDCHSCHRDAGGALHPRKGAPTELPGGWRDDPVLRGR
jgi:hypothetical protein